MITVVTNCWAVRHPQYAVFLRAQLSSLVNHPPMVPVIYAVIFDPNDAMTCKVLASFAARLPMKLIALPERENWRRAIGRNRAAQGLHERCELAWFTDCDYCFGEGCLDAMYTTWEAENRPELIFPTSYMANPDKTDIDRHVKVAMEHSHICMGIVIPDLWESVKFEPTPVKRAIGGLQCVSADYARIYGYLPDSKWQKAPDKPFASFKDDVVFRRELQSRGRCVGIPSLPNFYRLRHTEVGYGGNSGLRFQRESHDNKS
jgi:hypothetical protein